MAGFLSLLEWLGGENDVTPVLLRTGHLVTQCYIIG